MGDRTAKSRLREVRVTEFQFADDVAVYAATREMLEEVVGEFVRTAADWGLTVSLEKTKLLTMGKRLKPEDNLYNLMEERLPLCKTSPILAATSPEMGKCMVKWL